MVAGITSDEHRLILAVSGGRQHRGASV